MKTLVIKIKSDEAAQTLTDFLKSIDYVETVDQSVSDVEMNPQVSVNIVQGSFKSNEKPSDFAGIWNNRKKVDAKKLRAKAWQRKK